MVSTGSEKASHVHRITLCFLRPRPYNDSEMLSAQAYSFHQKSKLAISLSWIGGYTNIVCLLVSGHYVSHVTGNSTAFGRDFVDHITQSIPSLSGSALPGAGLQAALYGFLILMFFSGAIISAIMTQYAVRWGFPSKYILPTSTEALLLAFYSWGIHGHPTLNEHEGWRYFLLTGAAALAMGLQNATITLIAGSVVRTTHLTGVVTDLGLESVQYFIWYTDQWRARDGRTGRLLRVSQRHPSTLRLALLISIFGSFLFGVVTGTIAHHFLIGKGLPELIMIPPVLFLLWLMFMDWWRPIADLRELDPVSDAELKRAGIVAGTLPKTMGIYRLYPPTRRAKSRAPNFQHWVELLPKHWKVIILALAPSIHFDENSAMDLDAAVRLLHKSGRKLVLCHITPLQYKQLESLGGIESFGELNICSDIEFAVGRAYELLESSGPLSP